MNLFISRHFLAGIFLLVTTAASAQTKVRRIEDFNDGWKFYKGDAAGAEKSSFNDAGWRSLSLPHDWSIEGEFDKNNPSGIGGGALPGGIGWYRKAFAMPVSAKDRSVFIDFDGVYRNSEVWINEHYLGKRPNGYISFRYDLSRYLKYGKEKNVISVKVDNSQQPNSRWYSGSGIYRNVRLVTTGKQYVDHWGTQVLIPKIYDNSTEVIIKITTAGRGMPEHVNTTIYNPSGEAVATASAIHGTLAQEASDHSSTTWEAKCNILKPLLWDVEKPYLYTVVTEIIQQGKVVDDYATSFGIRSFEFDKDKGFILNGKPVKINGVCNHHDLGCLGAAVNTRALERQLQILKAMGCNGIRMSHNPPAPELLDLCDKMGFIVMDEAFDIWKNKKNLYDYHLDWNEWHARDLKDQLLRDRNHPSVFMWSIGNEVMEQYNPRDSVGYFIAKELTAIVKSLDSTRPVTSALNHPYPNNPVIFSDALDLLGYNYNQKDFEKFHERFPGKKFIATETVSALQTRGHYDMPSDSIRRWPKAWDKKLEDGNQDNTVSAYDNVSTPWGSTHEETWKIIKRNNFISGQYIWTGFDYIGEPTPYEWPSRSSYFGIIDLAGFPKDVYYMYQSEWTNKPMLHIFPHWNWKPGQVIDIWAYYNNADEVELFLNGTSLGIRKKKDDDLHVAWRVPYKPGVLKAISRKDGKTVLTKEIKTAGAAAKIRLSADRNILNAGGRDLSFITVTVTDANGNTVPVADNDIQFTVTGQGSIAGVDNGSQTSMESFKANHRKAFNGLCLLVVEAKGKGDIFVTASSNGLLKTEIKLQVK